ncbi:Nramp family divalent metal transporter [Halegenticoccus tardaugens]|uniref:Nramp family divalent metal transporter n=1 Tax=Halegenticoccus tardaugens TaxID=2071624 RepID=UPI00100AAD39|nr:Nramp family divalent metal transporter [Halegenticoccus tardaugens]
MSRPSGPASGETEPSGDDRGGERDRTDEDVSESIYASEIEGRQYRGTWYLPLPYDRLARAPETDEYPDRGSGGAFRIAELPRVPRVRHVVGPSAIMLGASLGSGETLFWPVLVAQHGWGLYWAFAVGVLTQFFINTELQRWTVATGESVFRSFGRVHALWPWVFLAAGFVSLGWPGWAAGAAQVGTTALGLGGTTVGALGVELASWKVLAVALMLVIWLSYHLSAVMYNAVEAFQVGLLFVAIGAALLLAVFTGSLGELGNVPAGALDAKAFPPGMDIAVFLGGLAFAGAGGYLNLSQSLWVREKGYGMGNYQGRVKNPLIGEDPEPIERDGFIFRPTRLNLRRWRGWWRVIQLEHLLTFVVGLLIGATVLMSVSVHHAPGTTANAIDMWLVQIAPQFGGLARLLIFVVLFVALFTTEYAIVESFVRNSADALFESYGRNAGWNLSRIFWLLLTGFTLWGIFIILFFSASLARGGPFFFLVVGAAMSGAMMWPYTALTLVVNTTRLPEHLQPGWTRVAAMWWASGFYGYFTVLLVGDTLATLFGSSALSTSAGVLGSGPGGLALWGVFVVAQAYAILRSIVGKRAAADTVADAAETKQPLS